MRRGKVLIKSKLPDLSDTTALPICTSSTAVTPISSDRCFNIIRNLPQEEVDQDNENESDQKKLNPSYIELYISAICTVGIIPRHGRTTEKERTVTVVMRKVRCPFCCTHLISKHAAFSRTRFPIIISLSVFIT